MPYATRLPLLLLPLLLGAALPGSLRAETGQAPARARATTPKVDTRALPGPALAPCGEMPAGGERPFQAGERLQYDLDVMGVRAGVLTLAVEDRGDDTLTFQGLARTNPFFENVRKVRGRATSFTRPDDLRPVRYREDATEDGVRKWAEVLFDSHRSQVDVHYAIGPKERRVRYPASVGPHDLLSLVYWVRTLDLAVGTEVCMDVYGNRKVWRLRGRIEGEEWVTSPAGKFKTWHLAGTAQRVDRPSYEKEIHAWISQDERRLPVAAVGEIDLGPVRALLTHDGTPGSAPDYGGGRW